MWKMNKSLCRKTYLMFVVLAGGLLIIPDFLLSPVFARVNGSCFNCHTIHNSQDGSQLNVGGTNPYLLQGGTDACVGCHSSDDNRTIIDLGGDSLVPIVNNGAAPDYPPASTQTSSLAGGNFYWVKNLGDAYGHNCLSIDGVEVDVALADGAPGMPNDAVGASCEGCHKQLNGCESCHKAAHHADDSTSVVGEDGGWYRFLKSSQHGGSQSGVIGIEDSDWEQTVSASDHNEYFGCDNPNGNSDNSMSDYCAGCHHDFHGVSYTDSTSTQGWDNESPWYRHPTHLALPTSANKDYRLYNTQDGATVGPYSPEAPIARDPSDLVGMSSSTSLVTPGRDQVFCLSCHRVHGSPYPDILRWDYTTMLAGGIADADAMGHGCFVCHTTKDE